MKQLSIKIPKPCDEPWQEMAIGDGGRHCTSCDTIVKDFTSYSNTQLHYYLSNNPGHICGRFNEHQLAGQITSSDFRNGPDLLGVILGIALFVGAQSVHSMSSFEYQPHVSLIQMLQKDEAHVRDGHEYLVIRFRIVDKDTHEMIPFARLSLIGENNEVLKRAESDLGGLVRLELTPDEFDAVDSLRVHSFEHTKKEIAWNEEWESGGTYDVALSSELIVLKGAIIAMPVEERKSDSRKFKRYIRREERRARREQD